MYRTSSRKLNVRCYDNVLPYKKNEKSMALNSKGHCITKSFNYIILYILNAFEPEPQHSS